MKKLLIFTLVLGLAALANAAYVPLTLTLNAPASATTGETITVTATLSGLTGSEEVQALVDGKIVVSGVANTPGTVTANANFDGVTTETFPHIEFNSTGSPHVANAGVVLSFTVTAGAETGALNFDLDDLNAGLYQYLRLNTSLANFSYHSLGGTYGPLTVVADSTTVVPEPMTIALLGLGGLLLRRRRK